MADKRKLQGTTLPAGVPRACSSELFFGHLLPRQDAHSLLSSPPGEIDRCLKKVSEGVEQFEDIWQKVPGLGLKIQVHLQGWANRTRLGSS